jgi:hypothetical protein
VRHDATGEEWLEDPAWVSGHLTPVPIRYAKDKGSPAGDEMRDDEGVDDGPMARQPDNPLIR